MGLSITPGKVVTKWFFIFAILAALIVGSLSSILSLRTQALVETYPIGEVAQVSAGFSFSCALANNQIYCWGSNSYGQLGNDTITSNPTPIDIDREEVLEGKNITQLAVGGVYACAIADSQAYCWGSGGHGRLGNGTTNNSSTPVAVDTSGVLADKSVTQLVAGESHTCALAEGKVYCWGNGEHGLLGNGTFSNSSTPVAVDTSGVLSGKYVDQIATGDRHTCALADGQVYCWGNGEYGRLGNGATSSSSTPVAVDTSGLLFGKTISQVTVGGAHSCVLADGKVYCWGNGSYSQLGNGTNVDSLVPVAVDMNGVLAGKNVTQLTAGYLHTCILADGQAYCWGAGNQLGNGTNTSSTIPVAVYTDGVLAGKVISQLNAGDSHNCAVASARAYCWGSNSYSQLGNGTNTSSTIPVLVSDITIITPEINSVAFTEVDGKNMMTINGDDLIDNSFLGTDWLGALEDPSSTFLMLNGTPLPWCTDGTGMTESELPGYPASDNPPCYYLIDSNLAPIVTPTEAKVWLPSDFDVTAPGTVSINGSATFAFNQPTSGGGDEGNEGTPTDNTKPTVTVDGKALATAATTTSTPQIAKRPTFTGTATPGATITVTVHSDPVSCSTTADSSGNWSCTLSQDLPPGAHTVYVTITNPDNTVEELGPYSVTVPGDTTLTNLLAPNTGFQTLKQMANDSPAKLGLAIATAIGLLTALLFIGRAISQQATSRR